MLSKMEDSKDILAVSEICELSNVELYSFWLEHHEQMLPAKAAEHTAVDEFALDLSKTGSVELSQSLNER